MIPIDRLNNSYLAELEAVPRTAEGTLDRWGEMLRKARLRESLVAKYSWSVPTNECLSLIVKHCWHTGIVEMGAGTGYWAHLLQQLGVIVVPYDINPPHMGKNPYRHAVEWTNIEQGSTEKLQLHAEKALMLAWPPYNSTFALECLKAYKGNLLVYIGESDGGCTADDSFFALLDEEWEYIEGAEPLHWDGIHDYVNIYRRKP